MRSFLITGSTDGIGLFTAQKISQLVKNGDKIYLGIHGRNQDRLDSAYTEIMSKIDLNCVENLVL